MSKLIITSTEEGKIKYIEGEEVEVSVSELEEKVANIESAISQAMVNPEAEIKAINDELDSKKAKRLAQYEAEVKAALERYNSDLVVYDREAAAQISAKRTKVSSFDKSKVEELEKQRAKLRAVLQNAKSQSTPNSTVSAPSRVINRTVAAPATSETATKGSTSIPVRSFNRGSTAANTNTPSSSRRIVF